MVEHLLILLNYLNFRTYRDLELAFTALNPKPLEDRFWYQRFGVKAWQASQPTPHAVGCLHSIQHSCINDPWQLPQHIQRCVDLHNVSVLEQLEAHKARAAEGPCIKRAAVNPL